MWLSLETTVGNRGLTAKKGGQFFQENIGVTPSIAAPGDTNPSDATANLRKRWIRYIRSQRTL